MIPMVSVVGKSDSGKTTLIEKLIPELQQRGYSVATVKHDVHGFEVDREGKDSWRHRKAGARCTVISSPRQLALIRSMDHDADLNEIRARFMHDADIIIAEGFKKQRAPRVEVFRHEAHKEPLCTAEDNLVALVSNQRFDLGVPCLDLNDISGLADILEERFLSGGARQEICLKVNGEHVGLKPFIATLMQNSIKGMISALKGCEQPESIEIIIK